MKKLLVLGAVMLALIGCREEHRYEYRYIELGLSNGKLSINAEGRYGKNYEKDGKRQLDYSYPYHVRFTYVVTPKDALMKLSVNDIQLIGEKTGTHHTLKDIQGDKVRVYGERKFIRISAGPLTADEYEYQNYILKAKVVIYRTETDFEEQDIEVLLETEYRKERRSDWFDEKMSV